MGWAIGWTAGVLAVSILPAPAMAAPLDGGLLRIDWTVPEGMRGRAPAGGLAPWSTKAVDRKTPLIDQLAPVSAPDGLIRRRRQALGWGEMELSLEEMRQSTPGVAGISPREKRLSLGLGSSWSSGSDAFSLGVVMSRMARAQPALLAGRAPVRDDRLALGLTWMHDRWMQVRLGWEADRAGRMFDGPTRMADIAAGAPLREAGMHMAIGFLPLPSRSLLFGIEAQDARVMRDDLTWFGTQDRTDARIGLFARARF